MLVSGFWMNELPKNWSSSISRVDVEALLKAIGRRPTNHTPRLGPPWIHHLFLRSYEHYRFTVQTSHRRSKVNSLATLVRPLVMIDGSSLLAYLWTVACSTVSNSRLLKGPGLIVIKNSLSSDVLIVISLILNTAHLEHHERTRSLTHRFKTLVQGLSWTLGTAALRNIPCLFGSHTIS